MKAGRVICEVGGKCYWEEVSPWLKRFAAILPFEAIAVNPEILKKLNEEEERLKDLNTNPVRSHFKLGTSFSLKSKPSRILNDIFPIKL